MTPQNEWQPEELAELDRLADDLHGAVPSKAELSSSFHQDLQNRLQEYPWTLRNAMNHNRLLRVAAALLLVTTLGGPIAALVMMFTVPVQPPTDISWLPPVVAPDIEDADQPAPEAAIPPIDPSLEDAFGMDWQLAVQRSSRMKAVIRQWQLVQNDLKSRSATAAPAFLEWSQASVQDLLTEFQRRCILRLDSPPPSSLEARLRTLIDQQSAESDQPNWLAAWAWVIDGPDAEMRQFF